MKLTTKIFILLQTLDIALTFFGIQWGIGTEANPLGFRVSTILLKFAVIIFVAYCLEKVNFGKLANLVLIPSFFFVYYNCFVIVFVLILIYFT